MDYQMIEGSLLDLSHIMFVIQVYQVLAIVGFTCIFLRIFSKILMLRNFFCLDFPQSWIGSHQEYFRRFAYEGRSKRLRVDRYCSQKHGELVQNLLWGYQSFSQKVHSWIHLSKHWSPTTKYGPYWDANNQGKLAKGINSIIIA